MKLKFFKKKYIYGCDARGDAESVYMVRYTIIECKNFQLCVHIFVRSDADDLHDHPWNFVSVILWRGYMEQTSAGIKRYRAGNILFRRAKHAHRVQLINNRRAVTLVIMGRNVRQWGFITKTGWKLWTKYFEDMRC